MTLQDYVDSNGGAISASKLARFFDVQPDVVDAWAARNHVAIINGSVAFTYGSASEFALETVGYMDEDAEAAGASEVEDEDSDGDEDDEEEDSDGDEADEEEDDESFPF